MKHKLLIVFSVLALVQMACGPLITVINNTPEKVRVIIKFEDNSYTVLPAPKEYKEVEVKMGSYTASAVSAKKWDEYHQKERNAYGQIFQDPENMTSEQINQAVDRISSAPERQAEMLKDAGAANCSSSITKDEDGEVIIYGSSESGLSLECTQVESQDESDNIIWELFSNSSNTE
jgi:hypothetical protein